MRELIVRRKLKLSTYPYIEEFTVFLGIFVVSYFRCDFINMFLKVVYHHPSEGNKPESTHTTNFLDNSVKTGPVRVANSYMVE